MVKATHEYQSPFPEPANIDDMDVPDSLLKEWQSIVDLLAKIAGVRAGLIMRVQNNEIEVFVASKSIKNPYQVGHKEHFIDSGLYCEHVVRKNRKLLVPNASKSTKWRNNPDIKYNMICYLGFPIRLPNGKPFGTICILDNKENEYSSDIIDIMEKMRNLIEAHLKLLHLSCHDPLTGLYNRTFFNMKILEEMNRADRYGRPITMLIMDIDNFKVVNDTFGHLKGDEFLREIALITTSSLRSSDIVFRYGGDEFIVLMPETSISKAVKAAEKLQQNIENSKHLTSVIITASIGAAERIWGESLEDWLKRADNALYRTKENGKNKTSPA